MKKKALIKLLVIIFVLNLYGVRAQAAYNNSLSDTIKSDSLGVKSKIMSNYKKNKAKENFKKDEIIVKIKTGATNSAIESSQKKYGVKSKKEINRQTDIVKFDNNKYSMDEMLVNLNNDLNVEYAEPNYISRLSSLPQNEPDFNKMWGLKNTITEGVDINVSAAWGKGTGNPNLVVGVLDSGIDYNHIDLKENIWINNGEIPDNEIDDDNNGYVDDYNGWDFSGVNNDAYDDNSHGTHVSGIIAASSNGVGTVGVAPTVKIMPLKVANTQGGLYTSDVVSAIQYGISKGVKLFNCSFGGSDFSQTEYDLMEDSDALFMCAAGNGDAYGIGMDNDSTVKNYPATYDLPNIMSVASIDEYGDLSLFSNYGEVTVDIAAPGSDIYGTVPGGYGYKNGTSMATPYVTGVAALVLSANMELTPIEIKNRILKSMSKLPQLESKIATGAILDAFAAVSLILPTDIDNNGATDIVDLALVGLAYNSRIGYLKYKRILDINNDGIVDIYDLVCVSKSIK
ncbi:MAG: S8 family serine peptidase [Clostridium sp.]|uniref:S8 family serine peptidase n=1 Tax=Clostridium sp. TaxID=1506 RepID=UPI003D6D866D